MNRIATIGAYFKLVQGATVAFADALEVSLDCVVCRRCHRTINFELGHQNAMCIKTHHPFPGKLLSKLASQEGSLTKVRYQISYEYEPFVDAKYPSLEPSGAPTWARISFTLRCPRCQNDNHLSTQNNIRRPFSQYCQCRLLLFIDDAELPVFTSTTSHEQ
jgi:hypothetical protein